MGFLFSGTHCTVDAITSLTLLVVKVVVHAKNQQNLSIFQIYGLSFQLQVYHFGILQRAKFNKSDISKGKFEQIAVKFMKTFNAN